MFKRYPVRVALLSCLLAPLLQGQAEILGVPVADDYYVNCEYRMAARFPAQPMVRDLTFQVAGRSAPARQFYVERDKTLLSVTIAHFADAPAIDRSLIDAAAASLRSKGQLRLEEVVWYDEPVIPGRQLFVNLADGRVIRGSVYMAHNRLYVTEAVADPNDPGAFRFEQSVSLIDEKGTDLDTNPITVTTTIGTSAGLPSRQYDCSRLNRPR
jgi:hypothetical protein